MFFASITAFETQGENMKLVHLKSLLAVASLFLAVGSAQATVYSNSADDTIQFFGADGGTTNYGQVFNLGGDTNLLNWSFYANGGTAGDLKFVVADWNGSTAVGPALYTSSVFSYGGGKQTLAFSNIDTALSTGSYIGFITVAGVANAATDVVVAGSSDDGGLAGGFRYLNSNGLDPLTLSNSWESFAVANMQFTAEFGDVSRAIPEPGILALFGLGFAGLAAVRRRKSS